MKNQMLRFTLFLLIFVTLPLTATAQVVDIPDPNLRAVVLHQSTITKINDVASPDKRRIS